MQAIEFETADHNETDDLPAADELMEADEFLADIEAWLKTRNCYASTAFGIVGLN